MSTVTAAATAAVTQARILVVEDEAIVARDIASQLELLGYRVVGRATHGADAVAQALALRPDLVLMDIQLAGDMDGISAAQVLHEQAPNSHCISDGV